MDYRIPLCIALFFGSGLVFRAIGEATKDSPYGVTLGLEALAMVVIIGVIYFIVQRKRGDSDKSD